MPAIEYRNGHDGLHHILTFATMAKAKKALEALERLETADINADLYWGAVNVIIGTATADTELSTGHTFKGHILNKGQPIDLYE